MYRKLLAVLLVASVAVLATGCVEREIVLNPAGDMVPDVSLKEGIEIDWQQVVDDCEDMLSEEEYPYGGEISFSPNEEDPTKPVVLNWTVGADCPPQVALEYANAYVKAFNDAVATQDFNYAFSTTDTYGGYFDKNDFTINICYNTDELKPEDYVVSQTVKAGTNEPLDIQDKYKGQ